MTDQLDPPAPAQSEAGDEGLPAAMGRLEFTSPQSAWGGDATDFATLLGNDEMLGYLGAECGIGQLGVVEVGHATAGDRSPGILAETTDGRRVAIENQYGPAGHDDLAKGLADAVAVGARGLVVVAEDHGDESESVAAYLNRVGGLDDEGIVVWLVQVQAVRRVGDTTWSPQFVVVAEPDEWHVAESLDTGEQQGTDELHSEHHDESGQDDHDQVHTNGSHGWDQSDVEDSDVRDQSDTNGSDSGDQVDTNGSDGGDHVDTNGSDGRDQSTTHGLDGGSLGMRLQQLQRDHS